MDDVEGKRAILFDLIDTVLWHRGNGSRGHAALAREAFQAVYSGDHEALASFLEAYHAVRERYLRQAVNSLHEVNFMARMHDTFAVLGPDHLPSLDQFVARYIGAYTSQLSLPQGHRDLLEGLHGCYRTALVTNFQYWPAIYRLLDHFELADLFDAVVISGEFGWRKPHPAIFGEALKRLNVRAEEAAFVGDDLGVDIEGATACGMDAILLDRRGLHPSYPGLRAASLSEVAEILRVNEVCSEHLS
jgi:HAD superfamily hydrolase (TIGR01549 family)